MAEPDELYTLRAQYWLGHHAAAIDEARSVARRPMGPALKAEREEFLYRAQLALGQADRVAAALASAGAASADSPGLQALLLRAKFDAAAGQEAAQASLCDQAKSLVGGGPGAASSSAQLVVAQLLLAAGHVKESLQLVHAGATPEHSLLALQLYLRLDRPDLARQQHARLLQQVDDDSVLAQLGSVYLGLAAGSTGAPDAIHSLNALSEQYGPSPYLLNLLACALLQQGDAVGAEQKLLECWRDHLSEGNAPGSHPLVSDTLANLIVCCVHQGKGDDAEAHLRTLQQRCATHPAVAGAERVTSAFGREATKYKV